MPACHPSGHGCADVNGPKSSSTANACWSSCQQRCAGSLLQGLTQAVREPAEPEELIHARATTSTSAPRMYASIQQRSSHWQQAESQKLIHARAEVLHVTTTFSSMMHAPMQHQSGQWATSNVTASPEKLPWAHCFLQSGRCCHI